MREEGVGGESEYDDHGDGAGFDDQLPPIGISVVGGGVAEDVGEAEHKGSQQDQVLGVFSPAAGALDGDRQGYHYAYEDE